MYRTTAPAAPGRCRHAESDQDEGFGAIAIDKTGAFACISDGADGFVWGLIGPVRTDFLSVSASTVPVAVVNETPLKSPFAPAQWILIRKYTGAVLCTIDGEARADFTYAGANVLASDTWPAEVGLPSSRLRCSYWYVPANQ